MRCPKTLNEVIEVLAKQGYTVNIDENDVLYIRRSRDGCIAEVAAKWLYIVRRRRSDGSETYEVMAWYEALGEEIGSWIPE